MYFNLGMGSKKLDEQLLIDGLINGDVNSFDSIYHRYVRELFFLSFGYVGDELDAQDIVQEAFIYLWDNKSTLKPNSNLQAYLRAIVKNASLNCLRNLKIREKHNVIIKGKEDVLYNSLSLPEEQETLDNDFESKLALVRNKLEQLPGACKKIFIMSVIEGYTYKEVSKEMGISVNTVKSQIKIAYKKIRNNVKLLFYLF